MEKKLFTKDLGKVFMDAKFQDKLRRLIAKEIEEGIKNDVFSREAKEAISRSIKVLVKDGKIQITSDLPQFDILVGGQPPGTMDWLLKAKTPIPIETPEGEVIFRWATAKSMAGGGWHHPGRAKGSFLERAKKASTKIIGDALREKILKSLQGK